jgi:hypothetical protein
MIQSNGNQLRKANSGQFQHKVIVSGKGRLPVNPAGGTNNGQGTNLNANHVPIANVPHVINRNQRQRG